MANDELIRKKDAIKEICEDIEWLESQGCTEIPLAERKERDVDIIKNLPTVQPNHNAEVSKMMDDLISRQAAIAHAVPLNLFGREVMMVSVSELENLPSAQPEHTCVNCGRTANNGGWYADGRTRCPIEEHYALPKDGYCHLWEKRNVTDDDYPERREDERPES